MARRRCGLLKFAHQLHHFFSVSPTAVVVDLDREWRFLDQQQKLKRVYFLSQNARKQKRANADALHRAHRTPQISPEKTFRIRKRNLHQLIPAKCDGPAVAVGRPARRMPHEPATDLEIQPGLEHSLFECAPEGRDRVMIRRRQVIVPKRRFQIPR